MAADEPESYEREQRKAVQAWKEKPPSVVERWIGRLFKPVAWLIGRVVPPSAIEGALRGADWLAQLTISKERVFRDAGVTGSEELKRRKLSELDALAGSVHRCAIGYSVIAVALAAPPRRPSTLP